MASIFWTIWKIIIHEKSGMPYSLLIQVWFLFSASLISAALCSTCSVRFSRIFGTIGRSSGSAFLGVSTCVLCVEMWLSMDSIICERTGTITISSPQSGHLMHLTFWTGNSSGSRPFMLIPLGNQAYVHIN